VTPVENEENIFIAHNRLSMEILERTNQIFLDTRNLFEGITNGKNLKDCRVAATAWKFLNILIKKT
jgi:hypothetical protein